LQVTKHVAVYAAYRKLPHKRLSIDTTYKFSGALSVSQPKRPQVSTVHPFSGPLAGGTAITLTGIRFGEAADIDVTIGGEKCTDVSLVSATQITCKTPALSQALQAELAMLPDDVDHRLSRDVVVTNSSGSGECEMQFTYADGKNVQACPHARVHVISYDMCVCV
jgi:hypothetical protein